MATGFTLDLKVEVEDVKVRLERFGKAFNENQILHAIGNRMLKWINDNFKAEGLEEKWAPLAESTVAARRRGSSRILQDTGDLRKSFVKQVGTGFVTVGTNDEKAKWHHEGTKAYEINAKNLPVMTFLIAKGQWRSAKKVFHPGLAKRPLLPSEETADKLATGVLQAVVDKAERDYYLKLKL